MLDTILQLFQELYTLAMAYAINNWWSFAWAAWVLLMMCGMTVFFTWCLMDLVRTWLRTRHEQHPWG